MHSILFRVSTGYLIKNSINEGFLKNIWLSSGVTRTLPRALTPSPSAVVTSRPPSPAWETVCSPISPIVPPTISVRMTWPSCTAVRGTSRTTLPTGRAVCKCRQLHNFIRHSLNNNITNYNIYIVFCLSRGGVQCTPHPPHPPESKKNLI